MWAVHFHDGAERTRLFRDVAALFRFLATLPQNGVAEIRYAGCRWLYTDGWLVPVTPDGEAGEPAPVGCITANGQPSNPGVGYSPGWPLIVLAQPAAAAALFALILPVLLTLHVVTSRLHRERSVPPPIPLPLDPDKQTMFLNAPNAARPLSAFGQKF